mmetsp:Transcript_18927/g.39870  ORF Transcript_18927/g.39870 Transcript_18927/m.39870 type:complete len:694 (-) Transcript_18927:53-2134(-)
MTAKKWLIIFALCYNGSNTQALCPTVTPKNARIQNGMPSLGTSSSTHSIIKRQQQDRRAYPIRSSQHHIILSSTTQSSSDLGREATKSAPQPNTNLNGSVQKPASTSTLTSTSPPELCSVDVRYNRRFPLTYDPISGRYLDASSIQLLYNDDAKNNSTFIDNNNNSDESSLLQKWSQFLHSAFVPEGVTPSYYRYMRWRILQRFVNANVHVIGTQSLLMGLRGMQRSAVVATAKTGGAALGAAAATNWVLKDTLGKLVRMAWASKMGRKFDPDAKRWRFRASLIYALGNGLEVSTYLHPQYFLVLAMLANSCKQMSMLTSSATRNALYNSFRMVSSSSSSSSSSNNGNKTAVAAASGGRNNNVTTNSTTTATSTTNRIMRGNSGGVENIGDITAKGEAQIAVVDLLGIASGIFLSRAVGVSVQNVFAVWVVLQIMEIFCMYHEMRSVVYKTFNFERMYTVLGKLLLEEENNAEDINEEGTVNGNQKYKFTGHIPTPEQIAAKEKIFLPPDHLARRAIAFGSPGRSALDPEELDMLINDVFRGEKYFLVVGQDVKNQRGLSARVRQWMRRRRDFGGDTGNANEDGKHGIDMGIDPQEQCHIVLHADANNLDILKSALALVILRKKLVQKTRDSNLSNDDLRSRDCMDVLREARAEACEIFPHFLRELTKQGWRPPLRSMLGRVSARADWKIQRK